MTGRVSKAPRGRGRGGRGDGGRGRGAPEPSRPSKGVRGRSPGRRDWSPDRSPEVDDKPPTGWFNAETSRWTTRPFFRDDYIQFWAVDEHGEDQAKVIGKITRIYKDDSTGGRPFECAIMATNDSDYHEYIENEMGHKPLFHLCKCKHSRCKYQGHDAFDELLHVDRYKVMEYKDARVTIKAWRECVDNRSDVMSTASWESRDRGTQKAEFLREDVGLSDKHARRVSEGPKPPGAPPSAKLLKEHSRKKDDGFLASDTEPEDAGPPPKGRRLDTEGSEKGRSDRAGQALDSALEGLDVSAPPQGSSRDAGPSNAVKPRSIAEQKAAMLREKLHVAKQRLDASQGKDAATGILREGLAARLRNVESAKKHALSGHSLKFLGYDEDHSLDVQDSLEALGSANADRRMLLRRMGKEQPGLLSVNTMSEYRTLLFSQDGELVPEDENSPIFLKYFLSYYSLHNPVGKIGLDAHRELRTYSEACDAILRGNNLVALDILSQQMKAKMLALQDGNWDCARWLQLLPEQGGVVGLSSQDVHFVRAIQAGHNKDVERALRIKQGSSGGGG